MLIAGWKSFAIRDFSSSFFFFTSVIFLEVWRFADQSICLQKNIHDKFRTRRERERDGGEKGACLIKKGKVFHLPFMLTAAFSLYLHIFYFFLCVHIPISTVGCTKEWSCWKKDKDKIVTTVLAFISGYQVSPSSFFLCWNLLFCYQNSPNVKPVITDRDGIKINSFLIRNVYNYLFAFHSFSNFRFSLSPIFKTLIPICVGCGKLQTIRFRSEGVLQTCEGDPEGWGVGIGVVKMTLMCDHRRWRWSY